MNKNLTLAGAAVVVLDYRWSSALCVQIRRLKRMKTAPLARKCFLTPTPACHVIKQMLGAKAIMPENACAKIVTKTL